MTRIGVLVNEGKQLGSGLKRFRSLLEDLGHADPPWLSVSKSKKSPPKVRELIDEHGVERILAWGGDGTVRRCIHTLIEADRTDVAIGIIPAGTDRSGDRGRRSAVVLAVRIAQPELRLSARDGRRRRRT